MDRFMEWARGNYWTQNAPESPRSPRQLARFGGRARIREVAMAQPTARLRVHALSSFGHQLGGFRVAVATES
jgi:hypothetical protein